MESTQDPTLDPTPAQVASTQDSDEASERHEPASERVREGYDSFPADSEASVDYTTEHPEWDGDVPLPQLGHLRSVPGHEMSVGELLASSPPELLVELTVMTPDGRRMTFSEAAECSEGHVPVNAEIADLIDNVYGSALTRFGAPPA